MNLVSEGTTLEVDDNFSIITPCQLALGKETMHCLVLKSRTIARNAISCPRKQSDYRSFLEQA